MDVGKLSVTSKLLLLPSPPSSVSLAAFRAAYSPALLEVLTQPASQSSQPGLKGLDIAIRWDDAILAEGTPRSVLYRSAQKILATAYKFLCFICAEKHIGEEYQNDINFRIVLVYDSQEAEDEHRLVAQGPFLPLGGLARSSREWKDIYVPEGENSESFLQSFTKIRKGLPLNNQMPSFDVHRLMGGTSIKIPDAKSDISSPNSSRKRHYSVAVGGTFDHLHAGHRLLLTATALVLEPFTKSDDIQERCLTIGITGDELLQSKKYAESLQSWDERQKSVYDFLSAVVDFGEPTSVKVEQVAEPGPNGHAVIYELPGRLKIRCVEISDPFGPTITDESVSALVISGETRSGGMAVNDKRTEKGWESLEIFEVDVLDAKIDEDGEDAAEDFASKISSTEIRKRLHDKSRG